MPASCAHGVRSLQAGALEGAAAVRRAARAGTATFVTTPAQGPVPTYARRGDLVRLARRRDRPAGRRPATSPTRPPRRRPTSPARSRSRCWSRARPASARPSWPRRWRRATGAELVRLQCYEGLDEARALYEWNYKKQLLRIQASRATTRPGSETHDDIFTDEFLLTRPLLTAIRREEPTVLLIDEVDKTDVEVEGLLLEVLSRLPGDHPRARHAWPPYAARSSCSPPTPPASCPRRSSGAASTCTSTTPTPSASARSCARQVPDLDERVAAPAGRHRRPGCATSS